MLLTSLTSNQIVGISITVIGIILAALFFIIYVVLKNNATKNSFKRANKESEGIWEFTKKNFLIFVSLFCCVMAITGIAMIIGA